MSETNFKFGLTQYIISSPDLEYFLCNKNMDGENFHVTTQLATARVFDSYVEALEALQEIKDYSSFARRLNAYPDYMKAEELGYIHLSCIIPIDLSDLAEF